MNVAPEDLQLLLDLLNGPSAAIVARIARLSGRRDKQRRDAGVGNIVIRGAGGSEKDCAPRAATTCRGCKALQAVGTAHGTWDANGCISEQVVVGALRAANVIVVVGTGLLAYVARLSILEDLGPVEIYALVIAGLLVANVFQFAGVYGPGLLESVLSQFDRVLAAWTFIVLFMITLGFAAKSTYEVSRLWVGLWALFGSAGLFAVRLLFRHEVRHWQRGGWLTRKVVLVGAGEHSRRLAEHLRRVADPSVRIVGVFDDRKDRVPARVAGHRVRGGLDGGGRHGPGAWAR